MNERYILSGEELEVIDGLNGAKIPHNADLHYFLNCNELKPLYSVSKAIGLVPSNVKKWADAVPGRYEQIGLYAFGVRPHKKQHFVNVRTFVGWAMAHGNTRRQIIRHFHPKVGRIKKGMGLREVVATGELFIFDELCSRGIIPKPFSSKRGRETLIETAGSSEDSRGELGLFRDEEFGEWLVDPARFFKYLVTAYRLVPES
ncbi:MAG: hypothetical protein QNK37_24230 [Acidobacteriota bacterium]|nr:hypothetical protein [Acidobacteriota bacterium]